MNESVALDAGLFVRPILDVLEPNDRLALFAYDDSVRTIVDFDTPRNEWTAALGGLAKPRLALERLRGIPGRKALVVLSTGIDTFSRARFDVWLPGRST